MYVCFFITIIIIILSFFSKAIFDHYIAGNIKYENLHVE